MTFFVDTSVWSLAFRHDNQTETPAVVLLRGALLRGETVLTTGLVIQELLQGFSGPKDRARLIERLSVLPLLQPDRETHIAAAELRNTCRRASVQIGTIDALIAQLCIQHDLPLLATDNDFVFASRHVPLRLVS